MYLGPPVDARLIPQIWTLPSSFMNPAGDLPTTQKTVRIRVLLEGARVGWEGFSNAVGARWDGRACRGVILVGQKYVNKCKHHHI